MKCSFIDKQESPVLNYEVYSFAQLAAEAFAFSDHEKDELLYHARRLWHQKQFLFGGMAYEYIILGISLYIKKMTESTAIFSIEPIITRMFKDDYNTHTTRVYSVYMSLLDIFNIPDQESLCL